MPNFDLSPIFNQRQFHELTQDEKQGLFEKFKGILNAPKYRKLNKKDRINVAWYVNLWNFWNFPTKFPTFKYKGETLLNLLIEGYEMEGISIFLDLGYGPTYLKTAFKKYDP